MKYAIILPDGAADEPVAALGGRTPFETAVKPNMDWIACHGRQGLVVTVPEGFSPGSDVATLSLFGYDPRVRYPGRAPLEAAAQGIAVGANDLIFRCNFVTIADGRMKDFTAGHISQHEAETLIAELNAALDAKGCRSVAGVSYRNLMVLSDSGALEVRCTPPHDIPDRPVADHLPLGQEAQRVRAVMDAARGVLVDHEVNAARRRRGENPATDIWLWGQGRAAALPSFESRFGVRGAAIAAVDLIRGIAKCAGMTVIDVPGATGYLDTDYAAKGRAACDALRSFDLVAVHIEAPDEAGHLGDAAAKVTAIEQIDQYIVGPLLKTLQGLAEWRILVAPDHPTPVEKRVHTADPPPFCMAGTGIDAQRSVGFSERASLETGLLIERGHELMGSFLRS